MRYQSVSYYISAFKSNLDCATNLDRNEQLASKLSKLGYTKTSAIGCYNGSIELSFIVANPIEFDIINLAKEFEQESIMKVYGVDNVAELIFIDNDNRKVIGKIKSYNEGEVSLSGKDYTFVGSDSGGKYYVVEEK